MGLSLPENRQPGCILLDKTSALNLRELLMAYVVDARQLAIKIYEALLRMSLAGAEEINIALTSDECIFINSVVKNHHWPTADSCLLQTWQVMHEYAYGQPWRGGATLVAQFMEEEEHAATPGDGVPCAHPA